MIGNKIVGEKRRVMAELFFFLDSPGEDKESFIKQLASKVKYEKDVGYAGFRSRSALSKFLKWSIYGKKQIAWRSVSESDVARVVSRPLRKCGRVISRKIRIFIFPTVSAFIAEKMGGVAGFSLWRNVIIFNIHATEGWRRALGETVGHEVAHAVALNFNRRRTVGDDLVFEGVAENFRKIVIGGGMSRWAGSVGKKEAKTILREVKPKLLKPDSKLSSELFFGTGKYPLWAGYAVGYHLVKSYLEKERTKDWKSILKTPPKRILVSSFGTVVT